MPTLIWLSVSVSTAAADTSEPVPAVVGRQTSGRIGTGNLVVADVIARLAAVRQHDGGDLGQVHVAAAAEADDGVGPKRRGRQRCASAAARSDGSGSPPEKTSTATPASLSGGMHRLDEAGLEQDRIGDDQAALDVALHGDFAELANRVAAEQQLAGGVKGPGGAHAMQDSLEWQGGIHRG